MTYAEMAEQSANTLRAFQRRYLHDKTHVHLLVDTVLREMKHATVEQVALEVVSRIDMQVSALIDEWRKDASESAWRELKRAEAAAVDAQRARLDAEARA